MTESVGQQDKPVAYLLRLPPVLYDRIASVARRREISMHKAMLEALDQVFRYHDRYHDDAGPPR